MRSVIDFHTHILPRMDDGSRSVEESIALLRMGAEQGVRRVVATPHFYAHHESPDRFLARRQDTLERLHEAMKGIVGLPPVSVGAEVYFFEGMSDAEDLPALAISGTNCVLVEMPMNQWSDRNLQELVGIHQKRGLVPLIAHIDRYLSPFGAYRLLERLEELPIPLLIQANAEFFTNRLTKRLALRLLKSGKVHLLGSDCHNVKSRPLNIADALQVIEHSLGAEAIEKIHSLENELMVTAD